MAATAGSAPWRSSDLDPGVRAMVCSGSLAGSLETYRRQGFSAVLAKPYSLVELRRKVETTLSL